MTELSNASKDHLLNFAIFEIDKDVEKSILKIIGFNEKDLKYFESELQQKLIEAKNIATEIIAIKEQDKKGLGSKVEQETRRLVKAIISSEKYKKDIHLPQGNYAAYVYIYFINKALDKYKNKVQENNLTFPEKWQSKHIDIDFLAAKGAIIIEFLADKYEPDKYDPYKHGFFNIAYFGIDKAIKSRIEQIQEGHKSYDPFADAKDACKKVAPWKIFLSQV